MHKFAQVIRKYNSISLVISKLCPEYSSVDKNGKTLSGLPCTFQFLSSNDLSVKVTSIIGDSYRLHSHVIGGCEPNYHLIMTKR